MESGELLARIIRTKTAAATGDYDGKWWIEGDQLCRKFYDLFSGRAECFHVIKEENGFAIYDDEGAFINRVHFINR